MRVWGKAVPERREVRGLACAILAGASRQELLGTAVHTLLAEGNADRIGVWLEAPNDPNDDVGETATFRGIVADVNGEETPAEWSRLSPVAAVPGELRLTLKSLEQTRPDSSRHPVIGPMIGMRHALWVPSGSRGRLRGLILAGSRKTRAALPKVLAESVAAEVTLALNADDERRIAGEREHDLASVRNVLAALASEESPETILRTIVSD